MSKLLTLGAINQAMLLRQSGSSNETEVDTYISGLTTPLSSAQITRLNTLVAALKTGLSITNLSDVFDAMYILGGETEESSLKNLVKNAHHCTAVNSPTFTQYEGFTGNGTSSYLRTNYNLSSDSSKFLQNNGSMGIYNRTADFVQDSSFIGAVVAVSGGFTIRFGATISQFLYRANTLNEDLKNISQQGFIIVSRNAADNIKVYRNKSQVDSKTTSSVSLVNLEVYVLARNLDGLVNSYSTRQLAFAFIGKGFSESEVGTITDAIEAYMDANGKGVIS